MAARKQEPGAEASLPEKCQLPSLRAAPIVVATVHPSSILRSADDAERERAFAALVEDLRGVKRLLDDE